MPKGPRSSYTAVFKLQVVAYAEETNNRTAGRKYGVNESVVRRWRSLKAQYEGLDDKYRRKCLRRGSQMTVGVNSELPSVVRSTALDTLPDEVTVKLEVNPATLDLSSNDSLALHLLAVAGKPVIPPSPVELSDMVCCSRHMEENLSLLASAMDVTDDEMEQLSMKYKSTQGQALQLLKIWQRNIGGSKQDLYKLLTSAGFSSAAKSLDMEGSI